MSAILATNVNHIVDPKHVETKQTTKERQKAEQVAKQFEAVLLGSMIKEMRSGTDLFGHADPSSNMFDTMFDEALAGKIGSRGLGLRKMVLDSIEKSSGKHDVSATREFHAGIKQWDPMIEKIAKEENVNPNLVRAVMEQESGGRKFAKSRAGACGLMQLMPDTARSVGVTKIFDPEENIRGGVRYLKEQMDRFGKVDLALAAYNAGPGAVEKHRGVPPYAETKSYVKNIMNRLRNVGLDAAEENGND